MERKNYIIKLYKEGYSIDCIIKKVFKNVNKSFYSEFYSTGSFNKELYCNKNFARNLVYSTILEYLTQQKEMKSLL